MIKILERSEATNLPNPIHVKFAKKRYSGFILLARGDQYMLLDLPNTYKSIRVLHVYLSIHKRRAVESFPIL